MSGIWILLLLIATAILPALIVFLILRKIKFPLGLPLFLVSFGAGLISLLISALVQNFLPSPAGSGLLWIFFGIFIRIALVEESSRVLVLFPLFKFLKRRVPGASSIDSSMGAAIGLAAGLGFAAIENAFYGMADITVTLIRAFTAAPIHGACGIRTGAAVSLYKQNPIKAIFLFISAIVIHGAYNLITVSPILPYAPAIRAIIVVLFAFTVLAGSLPNIIFPGKDENKITGRDAS